MLTLVLYIYTSYLFISILSVLTTQARLNRVDTGALLRPSQLLKPVARSKPGFVAVPKSIEKTSTASSDILKYLACTLNIPCVISCLYMCLHFPPCIYNVSTLECDVEGFASPSGSRSTRMRLSMKVTLTVSPCSSSRLKPRTQADSIHHAQIQA